MKSEKAFINGIWEKVLKMEYEEIQRKTAKTCHEKIMRTNVLITLSIMIAFALFIIIKPEMNADILYCVATISLATAYWLDKFISEEKQEKMRGAIPHES